MTTQSEVRPAISARPAPALLLASQLIFNLGFFAVVPFLALVMGRDFHMTATAVGVVLGARVFSQQGLFLVGGIITDRWGPRRAMLAGCLVRIAGYLTLALATGFPLFLLGAILTGMGGALFSPALESLVGQAEERRLSTGGRGAALFALFSICGEIGAVAGPLAGALLLGTSFSVAAMAGAAVFAVMAGVLWVLVPPGRAQPVQNRPGPAGRDGLHTCHQGLPALLRDRKFLAFGALYSVNLLAYNQLYFGLPVELSRSGAGPEALAGLFGVASVLTIALQWPMSRLAGRTGPGLALLVGLCTQSLAFTVMAALAPVPPSETLPLLAPVLFVGFLCLGHMSTVPVAMSLVLDFSRGHPSGIYYGFLASAGGCMVLLGNVALGPLYADAARPGPAAMWPWTVMAALLAVSAVGLARVLRTRP